MKRIIAVCLGIIFSFLGLGFAAENEGEWPMFQGNKEHTGYTSVSLRPDYSEELWSKKVINGMALNPVTVAEGKVYVSLIGFFAADNHLFVLDAQTGEEKWKKSFGSVFSVNPPSYAYGNVYIQTGNHASDTYLHAYNAETGELVFETPHAAQWERYYAPTIDEGVVYVNGGMYGGMYAFDAYSGSNLWFSALAQQDQWTPTIGQNHIYTYVGGKLNAHNKSTGSIEYAINAGGSRVVSVYGDDGLMYAVINNKLVAFDTENTNVLWESVAAFKGQPSYHDGVVYALNRNALTAVSSTTNEVLWSWTPESGGLSQNIIITDSHLIVGSGGTTYLVDRQTHEPVWTYPKGGHLSFAQNTLYIASADGTLTAVSIPSECLEITLPDYVTEGDGTMTLAGEVTLSKAFESNLVVNLSSDDLSEISVPATLTIPAGETNVTFDLEVLDDALLDGSKTVTITATTDKVYADGVDQILVYDNENANITLSLPQTTVEGAGTINGVVTLDQAPDEDVTITLISNNPTKIPNESVVVLAGQTMATFTLNIMDDNLLDGIQTATIYAEVGGWSSGQASVFIFDNETATLTLQLSTTVMEGDGVVTNAGLVSLSGVATSDIRVMLTSSDATEIITPTFVTISNGQSNASFDITVIDDTETDGEQTLSIVAQTPEFLPTSAPISVKDNDLHHFSLTGIGTDQPVLDPVEITLSAQSIDGVLLTGFTNSIELSATSTEGAVRISPTSITNVVAGTWTGDVVFRTIADNVVLEANSSGATGTSSVFNVTGAQMVVTPASLTNTAVIAGQTATRTMVISNTGNIDLEFSINGADNKTPTDPSLIAYLPLNGNANDETGNGHDGTVIGGATLTSNRLGKANSAYDFNGSDGYIDLGTIGEIKTVSMWVRQETRSGYDVYFGHNDFRFYASTAENGRLTLGDDTSHVVTPIHMDDYVGQWVHIVGISDGVNSKIYFNGTNVTTSSGNLKAVADTDAYLGKMTAASHYLNGQIDDVKIYNRVLSDAEITDLYNEGGDPSLVAFFPFNGNANDESGNGHDGTVNGATLTTDRFGNADSAYHFDGSDYITSGDVLDRQNESWTCSAWIRASSYDQSATILNKGLTIYGTPRNSGYGLRILGGTRPENKLDFLLIDDLNVNGSVTTPLSQLPTNEWIFISGVYDKGSPQSTMSLYVNGVLVSTNSVNLGSSDGNMPFAIGALYRGTTYSAQSYFTGDIDDVSIYNRALSDSEIQESYRNGNDGLIAFFPFNGNANDESGNGHDGTVNGATLTTDRFGNTNAAYDFNGSSASINCGNIINGFSNFTVSAWVNIDRFTHSLFMGPWSQQKFEVPQVNNNYHFYTATDTSYYCFGTVMYWDDGTLINSRTKYVVPTNEWHLITQTYDGNEIRQYDNGTLINTTVTGAHVLSNPEDFLIGKTCAYPNNILSIHHFDGKIDDLRIYNRALSEAEIQALHSEGDDTNIAAASNPETGLIASFPFNGNANDESGNGHNGTVLNGAAFTNDISGRSCMYFDGIDDLVRVPGDSDFGVTNFTLAAWVKPQENNNSEINYTIIATTLPEPRTGVQMALVDSKLQGMFRKGGSSPTHSVTMDESIVGASNSWHFVAVSSYRTNGQQVVELYVDGVLKKSQTITSIAPSYNNQDLLIGMNGYSAAAGNGWNYQREFEGFIDDVSIYNRALSESEIQELYRDGDDGLIASYSFNGNANDESGNGHDGTVNGATLTMDRFGNANGAYAFDGTNDFIEVSDAVDLRLSGTDFSITTWFKESARTPAHNTLIAKRSSGSANGWFHSITGIGADTGKMFFQVSGGYDPRAYSASALSLDEWHYSVMTYNLATQTIRFYVDGVLDAERTNVPMPNGSTSSSLFIGLDSSLHSYAFHGAIDDIQIYNRILSKSEIQKLYVDGETSATVSASGDTYITRHGGYGGMNSPQGTNVLRIIHGIASLHQTHSLVSFDLSAYAGKTIKGDSVDFSIDIRSGWNDNHITQSISVRELLADWDENTVTWANFGGTGFVETTHAGTNLVTRDVTYNGITEPVIFTLPASVVQRWIDDPSSNKGLVLISNSAQMNLDMSFESKETGNAPTLSFELIGEPSTGPSWVSVNPKTGTIAPGASVSVSVQFDASGMVAGDSVADQLKITSNDAWLPTIGIPVSMVILADELLDSDGDSLPDSWEEAYFGNSTNTDATADSDADGMSNLDEYIAGMDPTNATSFFMVTAPEQTPAGDFIIQWEAVTDRVYGVYWNTDLADDYQPLATNIYYPQNSYTDSVHQAESAGFYWIDVKLKD